MTVLYVIIGVYGIFILYVFYGIYKLKKLDAKIERKLAKPYVLYMSDQSTRLTQSEYEVLMENFNGFNNFTEEVLPEYFELYQIKIQPRESDQH